MTRLRRRARTDDRGAVLVEFAFVLPILALLVFSTFDLGFIVIGNSVGSAAARDGARVGLLNYVCADQYTSGGAPNGTGSSADSDSSCTAGATSAAYAAIQQAVFAKLTHLVDGQPSVDVRCLNVDTLAQVHCAASSVTLGHDLIEVKVVWKHLSASSFVFSPTSTDVARMTITGSPNLSAAPTQSNGLFYNCVGPDTSAANSVTLKGGTNDTSITSVTFTLSGGQSFTSANQFGGNWVDTVFYTALAPNTVYTYNVTFNPGSHVGASDPSCTFTTPAAPAGTISGAVLQDTNHNGFDETVVVTMSSAINSSCTDPNMWNLVNMPSYAAGTIHPTLGVSISGATVTLLFPEGTLGANTGVPAGANIAFNPSGTCDGATSNVTPTDGAAPVITGVTFTQASHGTAGLWEVGDSVTFAFSEPIQASSVPSPVSLTLNAPQPDTMTAPGILNGTVVIGNGYDTAASGNSTWTATATVTSGQVVLTLTGCSSSTSNPDHCKANGNGTLGTGSAQAVTFTPASSLTDTSVAHNGAAGSYTTSASFKMF